MTKYGATLANFPGKGIFNLRNISKVGEALIKIAENPEEISVIYEKIIAIYEENLGKPKVS